MIFRLTGYRRTAVAFWALTVLAIAIWSRVPGYVKGWDLRVYETAIDSMQAGHDPYADGIAVQRAFHRELASHPNVSFPWTYVYSPITLPLLRWAGSLPREFSVPFYWFLCVAGTAAAIWAGMSAVELEELPVFSLVAPAAIFFPGLLQNDAFFSANVAYALYGAVLASAVVGWRRDRWFWFYGAVLVASCAKAPMLSLLAIPVLSARRQWLAAGLTGAAAVCLFAIQPMVWPGLFANYLEAVELQFSFNRDFGVSPAGVAAKAVYESIPYGLVSMGVYALYAAPLLGVLIYLSRRYFAGGIPRTRWIPVVLLGTLLLNPRIMEYDVAPLTIPMALLAWRFLSQGNAPRRVVAVRCASLFTAANVLAIYSWHVSECLLLVGTFSVGVWQLLTAAPREPAVTLIEEAGLVQQAT